MDTLDDELEFQEFMDGLAKLQEQIFLGWLGQPLVPVLTTYHEIVRYGDEPVFADMIFDRMLKESECL